jgi:RimJ/RimL family protein N-acetyltransferase
MTLSGNLLRGDKVRLTALTDGDFATIARWYEDAGFLRLFDSRPAYPKTTAGIKTWVEDMQKSPNCFVFAVRPLGSDECIGYLELDGIEWAHGVTGMGLGFGDPAHRGKGYGYEASLLALRFAFQELNLHRVTVTIFSYNAPSLALFEKLGFTREGVFREYLRRDGRRYDMILFGLLRHEWEARHGQALLP